MAELNPNRIEIKIHDSPNQFVGYSNINGVTMTPEEAILHFAIRRQDNPNEADGVAKMYLSLPHAKRLMIVLIDLMGQYEVMFGEVKPDAQDRLTPLGLKHIQEAQSAKQEVAE